ncbi:immunoglobulin domain-containing protein oig-4-like [Homarus americanus]|uniref:Immunoglobulin domain-containing protein oig-4-like n=1 Tax=Homarus americanus TaxID=6706 RepID=A0A8J5N0Y3_HOMAM|nr:immunoglobulin domain-containing protein oig-4-like [Homarus americanus]KAG7171353.1 Immunoglobulin domain-containing protein oig-4-like [Homarus americanus]
MKAYWAWVVLLLVLVVSVGVTEGKRGKGRGKKGRKNMSNRGSITKFKSEDSRAYYNHNGGAKITIWSHFESEYVLGRKIVFMCKAEGEPRPVITWFKDGIELYAHSFFQVHEWKEGKVSIKSKMEIDPATQMDAGYYECQADNKYAVDVKGFSADYSIEFV